MLSRRIPYVANAPFIFQTVNRPLSVVNNKMYRYQPSQMPVNVGRMPNAWRITQQNSLININPRFFSNTLSVTLPDLGEGTKEATIREWYVEPGTKVEEYDDLVEVYTDKLVAKIPSTASGIVSKVNYEVDDVCLVGHSLLSIEIEGEPDIPADKHKQPDPVPEKPASKPAEPAAAQTDLEAKMKLEKAGPVTKKALSTPAVRHLAKKNKLDINQITGTGRGGRVTKQDVLNFMSGGDQPAAAETLVMAQETAAPVMHQSRQVEMPALTGVTSQDKVIKISGMKKAMTKTMTQSLSVPTFTFTDDMDGTNLIKLRQEMKTMVPGGISLLPFLIKAMSLSMNEFPLVNSVVDPELDAEGYIKSFVTKADHNYSVAVDSADGLTTPNIKNVNMKSIGQINADLKDLVERANNRQLTSDDFKNGTFSVSSVGNISGKYFVPTILVPQAAIIAIGKSYKAPKYVGGGEDHKWEPMDMISFSITADHRIIDGATIARFSARMKEYVENPNLMLISV